jgi:Dolichyl-phosphate-mannose-protein mannosyltransferase
MPIPRDFHEKASNVNYNRETAGHDERISNPTKRIRFQMLAKDSRSQMMPNRFKSAVNSLKTNWKLNFKHHLLFFAILGIGIFARTWEYRSLPPGLHQDEASIGYDAYSVYHFGIDRNGMSYPIHFISWGSGQNALYGYISMPFVALLGLRTLSVRLPMLISAILTLLLMYEIGKASLNKKGGLIAMFFLAISPWHIMLSRWGLESNILPFFFTLGIFVLLKSKINNHWYLAAAVIFALCLYAYTTALVAIPLFLVSTTILIYASGRLRLSNMLIGLTLFTILAIPIALFLIVNKMQWNSLHLGWFTIPRFPSEMREQSDIAIFNSNPIDPFIQNLKELSSLLFLQTDGVVYDSTEYIANYGYFYKITFPLMIIGIIIITKTSNNPIENKIILLWFFSALPIGLLVSPDYHRLNLIFIPLILFCAAFFKWLSERKRIFFLCSIALSLIAFASFLDYYCSAAYKSEVGKMFFPGLLGAIDYSRNSSTGTICIDSNKINMPYIFVLFAEKTNPYLLQDEIVFKDPAAQFREVTSLGRYKFGLENCPIDAKTTYVLFFRESRPLPINGFVAKNFESYTVYIPK